MKKKILFIILIMCMFIIPTVSLAEIEVIESKRITADKPLNRINIGVICINGYEYVVVRFWDKVSIVQSFRYNLTLGKSIPKKCKTRE